MSNVEAIQWVFVGILISLLLPTAVNTLRQFTFNLEGTKKPKNLRQRIVAAWKKSGGSRYFKVVIAAAFVACVLVLLFDIQFSIPRDAAIAGFAWESLIGKLLGMQNVSQ